MASLRAPGAIQGADIGSPLRSVALAGKVLDAGELAPDNHPAELALRKLVDRMIAKTLAMRLCRRDLGGRYRRIMACGFQVARFVAVPVLAGPPLAPPACHRCPP